MKKTPMTILLPALASAFGTEVRMFDFNARRGKSLQSYYPKRNDSEIQERLELAKAKRLRKNLKRSKHCVD